MKKINIAAIAMSAMMMASLTACGGGSQPPQTQAATAAETTKAAETTAPAAETTAAETEKAGETTAAETGKAGEAASPAAEGTLSGPYIVTSCGQSPGAVMVNMVAVQAGKTSMNDNGLTAEALDVGDYKTLIVTTGTSMKGMGAAGTDVDAEIERCVALINKAKEEGMTIVGAHVEGMARRADSSDTASIEAVMELADQILVIDESDSDSYFTDYAKEHNKPLIKVKDALSIGSVLN